MHSQTTSFLALLALVASSNAYYSSGYGFGSGLVTREAGNPIADAASYVSGGVSGGVAGATHGGKTDGNKGMSLEWLTYLWRRIVANGFSQR